MTKRVLTILFAFVAAVFGAANVSADTALNGRWVVDDWDEELVFDNGTWELWADGYIELRGTYTVGNGTIALTSTHANSSEVYSLDLDNGWYTKSDLTLFGIEEIKTAFVEEFLDELLELLAEYTLDELREEMDNASKNMEEIIAHAVEMFGEDLARANREFENIIIEKFATTDGNRELIEIVIKIAEFTTVGILSALAKEFDDLFWTKIGTYTIHGNTMRLAIDLFDTEDAITLTRR